MESAVIVKSKETADAFALLGITAQVEGSTSDGGGEDVNLMKSEIDTLKKAVADKDDEIARLKESSTTGGDSLVKADIDKKFAAIGLISMSIVDGLNNLQKSLDGVNESTAEAINDLREELDTIAKASVGRRSLGGEAIPAAFETGSDGRKALSKSAHIREITSKLDELSQSEDSATAEMYADASMRYEVSRSLTKAVVDDLAKSHGITITE